MLCKKSLSWLVIGCLSLVAPSCFAWSSKVHQVICEMAWQQMQPETKRFVNELRERGEDEFQSFSHACAWADTVRDQESSTYEYHFMNVQRGANSVSLQRDCPAHDCVLVAVDRYLRYVTERSFGGRENERRLRALWFLAHFVADLHQPLHVAYAEDRGGNTLPVRYRGETSNLHGLWDFEIPDAAMPRQQAARGLLQSLDGVEAQTWKKADLLSWAEESYGLARQHAYPIARDQLLSDNEVTAVRAVVIKQMQRAAVRLAWLLDEAAKGRVATESLWSD